MITFKLCNSGKSVVGTREDGANVSYSIEAEEYKQWLAEGNTPEPEFTEAELLEQEALKALQEAKQAKELALASITVTTQSGKVFDGRDIDQQRMVSAIMSANAVGITETYWKLADNSVAMVTLMELKEALALSIQALGAIIMMEVVV